MKFFHFPTSPDKGNFHRSLASRVGFGVFAFIAAMSFTVIQDMEVPAFAEEIDEPKELPRRVLRHTPPIFEEWTFENHEHATIPSGFVSDTLGMGRPAEWQLVTQTGAPSRSHVLRQTVPCSSDPCYQILLNEKVRAKYMDLSVGMLADLGTPSSGAGLVFNAQDHKNFLAVLIYPATNMAKAIEFIDGEPILLKEQKIIPKKRTTWHFMRIHLTSIVSREVVELSFDNQFVMSLEPKNLKSGNIGLITTGDGGFAFDNLRAVEITTGIPISRPPAY